MASRTVPCDANPTLAHNLPNAIVHTLDLPEEGAEVVALIDGKPVDDCHLIERRELGKCFRGTPLASRIVQHTGDSRTYDYTSLQKNVSFFLIDGSHTRSNLRSRSRRESKVPFQILLLWSKSTAIAIALKRSKPIRRELLSSSSRPLTGPNRLIHHLLHYCRLSRTRRLTMVAAVQSGHTVASR